MASDLKQIVDNERPTYIIGVDPDVDKSGLAVYNHDSKEYEAICTVSFPALLEKLYEWQKRANKEGKKMRIYVEAGWLCLSNWHLTRKDSKAAAAAKGNSTGRNHETGRKIIECAEYFGMDVVPVKPLVKHWKGKDGKITTEELSRITHTDIPRCNQEARDAALIAFHFGR